MVGIAAGGPLAAFYTKTETISWHEFIDRTGDLAAAGGRLLTAAAVTIGRQLPGVGAVLDWLVTSDPNREATWLDEAVRDSHNIEAAIVDTVSMGLSRKLRDSLGGDNMVDYESGAYQDGTYLGMAADLAINAALTLPSGGAIWAKWVASGSRAALWARRSLMGFRALQGVGAAVNATDAYRRGDNFGALVSAFDAVTHYMNFRAGGVYHPSYGIAGSRLFNAGSKTEELVAAAKRLGGTPRAFVEKTLWQAANIVQTAGGIKQTHAAAKSGDWAGALIGGAMTGYALHDMMRACFAAGTKILVPIWDRDKHETPTDWTIGYRAIEEIERWDWVVAKDENDPNGPLMPKRVEAVFRRTGAVARARAWGKDILTTAEHPFYEVEHGTWTPACELQEGNSLLSHDGQLPVFEGLAETGEVATLYNLRVADCHTYFVGGVDWGFSVWAHNAYNQLQESMGAEWAEHGPALQRALDHARTGDRTNFMRYLREYGAGIGGPPRRSTSRLGRCQAARATSRHARDSTASGHRLRPALPQPDPPGTPGRCSSCRLGQVNQHGLPSYERQLGVRSSSDPDRLSYGSLRRVYRGRNRANARSVALELC